MKSKGEKERYTHLNAEFQRIAGRDKKAFLSDQCREIEGNNRIGKTRDLFNKIRDTKGTFPAKIGSIKGRNAMDLTEAEDIKKRWQEYTEELYKRELHDPDKHDGMITHLEPDILVCNVKWTLGRITWQPTPVFLPGESHGQRSLVGYSPRGCKELDTTERLSLHFSLISSASVSSIPFLSFIEPIFA